MINLKKKILFIYLFWLLVCYQEKECVRMNVTGATICDELPHPETCDIVLPNQKEYVSQIAVDVYIH